MCPPQGLDVVSQAQERGWHISESMFYYSLPKKMYVTEMLHDLHMNDVCFHILRFLCCRFFARLGRNAISIYECPDMGLLDKKSLKLDAVQVGCPPVTCAANPTRVFEGCLTVDRPIQLQDQSVSSATDYRSASTSSSSPGTSHLL